jgi:hypothetical protein
MTGVGPTTARCRLDSRPPTRVDPKPPAVTIRFANTRDPSLKIDRGQSLLVAEITLAGVVECRIRLGVFTRSHDM